MRLSKSARIQQWLADHPDASAAEAVTALGAYGVTANDVRQARYQARQGRPTRPALPTADELRAAERALGSRRKAAAHFGITASTAQTIATRARGSVT